VAGCRDADPGAKADVPGPNVVRDQTDDLFASPSVFTIYIEIAPRRLEALKGHSDTHEYVTCAVREGDRVWDDVGIHCRGNPAKELATGKPDLIVTFDKFISGQRFHGERRLVLQACRTDPSYLVAPIALEMFQAAGVPAARCTFARVHLNGRLLGLYLVIEGVEREFLERHFHDINGNLYDEGHPPDVTGKLEKARGRDREDQSDVDALAAAAQINRADERWNRLEQLLDMDRFLVFTAVEILLWQEDSYSLDAHKFRLYHDPETDRMIFFPKCVERVLLRTNGPVLPPCKGVVARAVLDTPEGAQRYRETVARLLDTVFRTDKVEARVRELVALIRPAAAPDAVTARAFDRSVAAFLDALARRREFVTAQLNASLAHGSR
jgi:hypothetical protein